MHTLAVPMAVLLFACSVNLNASSWHLRVWKKMPSLLFAGIIIVLDCRLFGSEKTLLLTAGNVSDVASRLLTSASLGARSGAGMGSGGDNSPNGPNDQMVAQTIVTALKQAQVPSAVQAQAFAQAFAQSLGPAQAYDTSEVLMIAAVSAGQTSSITQGYSQVCCWKPTYVAYASIQLLAMLSGHFEGSMPLMSVTFTSCWS